MQDREGYDLTTPFSFLGRVLLAEHIVKSASPEAEFYEVHLPRGVTHPTSNDLALSQLKALWNVPKGTGIITSYCWDRWNKPQFADEPWLGPRAIPFPIKL